MVNKNKQNFKRISLILMPVFIVLLLVMVILMLNGNTKNSIKLDENNQGIKKDFENISLEVYHFHGQQCASCIAVGDLTEKTLNTYFEDELDSGTIKFGHIDGRLEENYELVKKYGATGSSIWIGTYLDGEFHKEEKTRVWYKISNEEDFMTYFKGEIEKRLNGNLT
ncbi:MAG: nitrophenyl compound nitroreductase subunit ArsF family protein [Nanoarchaeota archaeon]